MARDAREFASIQRDQSSSSYSSPEFAEKLREWADAPSVSFAAQLVGSAFVNRRLTEASDAAKFLIEQGDRIPSSLRKLATRAVHGGPRVDATLASGYSAERQIIRNARRRLRLNETDCLAWVDLAQGLVQCGKAAQAERPIATALGLGAANRFVIRSAGRFFVHRRDPDRAHELFLAAPSASSDPWLVAGELASAAAAETSPKLVRVARRMLDSSSYSNWHLNELAAALATLEHVNGKHRKARQLFRQALLDPSENTIAQVRWAAHDGLEVEFTENLVRFPGAHEASAWSFYRDGEWDSAFQGARMWLLDQPFSTRPAVLGSYIAAVAQSDYDASQGILEIALKANPRHPVLLNNLAFACANLGQLDRARDELQKIQSGTGDDQSNVLKNATLGLIEYRAGRVELGRRLYRRAAERARTAGHKELLSRLYMFWVLEELSSAPTIDTSILEQADHTRPTSPDKVQSLLSDRIRKVVKSRGLAR